ncbi:MAG: helix-turn-helix transcriptional regulator, partial [Clostridia bacterium]|nr:helix-turn-helix transcriptional regulator [Clostridia bacterium]
HFVTSFGVSPKEFIMQKKIEAAKRMIATNESTLQSIATVLHFCDSHHFFRCFKKYTGMSPSEYRGRLLSDSVKDETLPQ